MDYRQARLELKKGRLRPLYLFSGIEDILKEELLQDMVGLMKSRGLEPDLLRMDGKKLEWPELRRELEQVTIFSQGRILLVSESPYFASLPEKSSPSKAKPSSRKSRSKEKDEGPEQAELAAILNADVDDTLLIISVQNADKRRKTTRYLEKAGALVEFPSLRGVALENWVRERLARNSRQIDKEALALLVERSGENLSLLQRELEKLITSLGTESIINYTLVDSLVPESVQGNIFNMVDELGRKNATGALNHFYKMRRQNEPPLRIFAMIARHFRLLYRAELLRQSGLARAKIPPKLKVPPFVADKLMQQLPNFPGNILPRIIRELKDVDLMIKTGRLSDVDGLEQLILKLTFS